VYCVMESRAGVEEYRRLREPDPEMDDGGYRTPHKPIFATLTYAWHANPQERPWYISNRVWTLFLLFLRLSGFVALRVITSSAP